MQKAITLFDRPGPVQTDATLDAARERAEELGIKTIVVATTTGATAVKAQEVFSALGAKVIGVTLQAGTWAKYDPPNPDLVKQIQQAGGKVLTATHTLMGNVGTAIREKFGGVPEVELIAYTYYTFGQGMKVAVEVAVMAADAGLLDMEEEIISIAGTNSGADTAIVLKPAYSTQFFDLRVREIIAMPR